MNFETVGQKEFEKKVHLKGIAITPKVVNGSIDGVVLSDVMGNTVIFEKREYSFSVMVPKKPTVKKWKVTAKLKSFGDVEKVFDVENDAIEAKQELERFGAANADWNSVEIEVEES